MRKVPEWLIQSSWFLAGVCATGAVWYLLSIKEYFGATIAGIGAVIFYLLAVFLHRSNDKVTKQNNALNNEIVLQYKEEKITFKELVRSVDYDVVKVNAHTHMLGVKAEQEWIRRRYPKSNFKSQILTTLDALEKKNSFAKNAIHFDVIEIEVGDGRIKKIYFDISDFFTGKGTMMDPSSVVAEKLRSLYEQ
ncbi:MAG: hypothetical protein RDU14_02530 [Melioribacteraceae bacterium]|nr:hypothetical protein [Melioribacteraceae bacterium]